MLTSDQMRAARSLLRINQRALAELAHVSLPTIQRMEASEESVRCTDDSRLKVMKALQQAGVELLREGVASTELGRGVRLKRR